MHRSLWIGYTRNISLTGTGSAIAPGGLSCLLDALLARETGLCTSTAAKRWDLNHRMPAALSLPPQPVIGTTRWRLTNDDLLVPEQRWAQPKPNPIIRI